MSDLTDWFGRPIQPAAQVDSPNPCVRLYGPGPENKQCKECAHLHGYQQAATWYKCDQRPKHKRGISGDHRVRWPACKRFVQEEVNHV
jgi:hypothetical protein